MKVTHDTRTQPETGMQSDDDSTEDRDTGESQDEMKIVPISTKDAQVLQSPLLPLTEEKEEKTENSQIVPVPTTLPQRTVMPRKRAILMAVFLLILVFNAARLSSAQFIGAEGWASVLGSHVSSGDPSLLRNVAIQLRKKLTPGVTAQATPHLTPQEYIDALVQNMTLDQKLGQMMIVQFVGPEYGLAISTMISQYNVGAVILFGVNNNIQDKTQLKSLTRQMQSNSKPIPLVVAIDQEGGTVDRLVNLDGPRPSEAEIGATNDPNKATQQGNQDAQDLSSYGINLNLAPVVDVTNVFNPQLYLRTFGDNPTKVTKMAGAYLRGLQRNGKVLGALKHFPGLGDVGAVLVTHEIVTTIDGSKPSSLSYKVITGILRNELGFQGVVITDSLTMEGITAYYPEAQAAALAIEAGSDLLMGALTPNDVANMISGIKQAINTGEIGLQRVDESVRRILMLKYQMGLIRIPTI